MLTLGIRAFILYLAVIFAMRLMGKSAIGKLEPFEFVLIMLIADLVSVPMEDIAVPLFDGILPLVTIMAAQIIFSWLALKSSFIRQLFSGEPSVLIYEGKIDEAELRKLRVNIEDLIEQIRIGGYANLSDIQHAIMETSGDISVIAKKDNADTSSKMFLPAIIVNDGSLVKKKMQKLNITIKDLEKALHEQEIDSYKHCLIVYRETDGNYFMQKKLRYQGEQQ